jgi:C4-dicarboxylate-specific signal transduction histidine kinase
VFAALLYKALLGDLTATLLHDANNPITAILNYARLLQMRDIQPQEREEFAKSIMTEGERIAELTHCLKLLARPKSSESRGANLNDALSLAIYLYKTRFRHDGITVEFQSGLTLSNAKLSLPDLLQIILPLFEQARQALNASDFSPATEKILRCCLSQTTDDKNDRQRITFIHNGMSQTSSGLNLFNHLFSTTASKEQVKLIETMTQVFLAKRNCKIEVERQADGWTVMHLEVPA